MAQTFRIYEKMQHRKNDAAFYLLSSDSRMFMNTGQMDFSRLHCTVDMRNGTANDSPTRLELTLPSCFRLLLALDRRLLVMLALANLSDDAVFCARTLETLESSVQGLVLTNAYFCHEFFPPFVQRLSIKRRRTDAPYKLKSNTSILYHSLYDLSSIFCMRSAFRFRFVNLLQNSPAYFVHKSACGWFFRQVPPAFSHPSARAPRRSPHLRPAGSSALP